VLKQTFALFLSGLSILPSVISSFMNQDPPVQDPADEAVIPQHHRDAPCECTHRHAEHSIFGSCHGCNDCSADDDLEAEHGHPYQRCACTNFELAVASFEPDKFSLTA
jgi:hypothetical protein